MRILIAEDEFIERKAMQKFIKENFTDIHVAGEAANGKKAIDQAKLLKPDVVLMDIKMPEMDGLEAIKQIYEYDASIKFVLISAYDSFDYAKQAMNYGIKDYILKPSKKEEIVKTLLRIKSEIDKEKERQAKQSQSDNLWRERFVSKLMQDPLSKELKGMEKVLFPEMKSGFFLVLMSHITFDVEHIHLATKQCIPYPFVLLEKENHFIIYVVANDIIAKEEVLTIAQSLYFHTGRMLLVGAGLPYTKWNKMQHSYREAYAAGFQLKSDNKRKYGFISPENTDVTTLISDICGCVETGNGEEAASIFKGNHRAFQEKNYDNLYIKIKELLTGLDIAISESTYSSLRSTNDWQQFITMCGMKVSDFYQSKQFLGTIKKYLEEHYAQEITLEDAALKMNLSPNYFSNVFKQEFGVTFIEYITSLRMKKAKELMKENTYVLKEISYKVGYNNPNYFSRVFKKYYHLSPKQYQQKIFKK